MSKKRTAQSFLKHVGLTLVEVQQALRLGGDVASLWHLYDAGLVPGIDAANLIRKRLSSCPELQKRNQQEAAKK